MLDAFKRLIGGSKPAGPDWSEIAEWARSAGYAFKRSRDAQGFVVEGGSRPWRLEVGPSQRDYIASPELRLRCAYQMPSDLQMLVISRSLMQQLDNETFESFTDPVKTYADDSAPDEMRWLAMFPKLGAEMLGELAARVGAVAFVPRTAEAWLSGAFAQRLQAATSVLPADMPLVLITQRSRVTLRTELRAIDGASIANWIALFESAVEQLPEAVKALKRRD